MRCSGTTARPPRPPAGYGRKVTAGLRVEPAACLPSKALLGGLDFALQGKPSITNWGLSSILHVFEFPSGRQFVAPPSADGRMQSSARPQMRTAEVALTKR